MIKINLPNTEEKLTFDELPVGAMFLWDGGLYVKVRHAVTTKCEGVWLNSGIAYDSSAFGGEKRAILVDATIDLSFKKN